MAFVNGSSAFTLTTSSLSLFKFSSKTICGALPCSGKKGFGFSPLSSLKESRFKASIDLVTIEENEEIEEPSDTVLHSFTPLPLFFLAALPGAGTVKSLFTPFVELVKSLHLPNWLVHWGHPGNMAIVLFAMGGYGTYLGFRIKISNDVEEKAMAKDLHPKLLAGMFFFFALGATGGVTSLLTSDKPIFESPHALTGLIGLTLLTIQTALPSLFESMEKISPKCNSCHDAKICWCNIILCRSVSSTTNLPLSGKSRFT